MAYELPPLPYAKEALEPYIDATTMEIHHDKHHGAYVANVNKAIAGKADLEKRTVEDLIRNLDLVPADIRTAVRNNGGGHANHSMFWRLLAPRAGGAPPRHLSHPAKVRSELAAAGRLTYWLPPARFRTGPRSGSF